MKPDRVYSYFKGKKDQIPRMSPELARAIIRYGTCICIEPEWLSGMEDTPNWGRVESRLQLLMMIGRGVPVFVNKVGSSGWEKTKL